MSTNQTPVGVQAPVATFKVVIVGASGVGKTTLIRTYVDGRPPDTREQPTIGVDFIPIRRTMGGHVFTVQLWDTAGQERFLAVVQTYYRGCAAIIGVVDLHDAVEKSAKLAMGTESLGDAIRVVLRRETDSIRTAVEMNRQSSGAEPLVLVVGNKIDRLQVAPDELAARNELRRMAIEEFHGRYADVSALANTNVRETFDSMVVELVRRWEARRQEALAAERAGGQRPLAPEFTVDLEARSQQRHRGGGCCSS